MALQILVYYHDLPLVFDVQTQEKDIYHLRHSGEENRVNGEYIPQKIVIRRKGKIWVSDIEMCPVLIGALKTEIGKMSRGGE